MMISCEDCLETLNKTIWNCVRHGEIDLHMVAYKLLDMNSDDDGHLHMIQLKEHTQERLAKFYKSRLLAYIELRAHPVYEKIVKC